MNMFPERSIETDKAETQAFTARPPSPPKYLPPRACNHSYISIAKVDSANPSIKDSAMTKSAEPSTAIPVI
jgi:hypothetical protein